MCAMVRAECDVAPESRGAAKSTTERTQARVRKVATLARSGEKGCAFAAATNAPQVPDTEQIVQ